MNDIPEKIKILKVAPDSRQLESYHYDNDVPVDKNGEPVAYDNKKHDMESKQFQKQAESRKKNSV